MIHCRMVAVPEALDDGKSWSFYLLSDTDTTLEATLTRIEYEWGDMPASEMPPDAPATVAPRGVARLWRDDGTGAEVRQEHHVRVRNSDGERHLTFEFPKLYRIRTMPVVPELSKPGHVVNAEGEARD